MLSSIRQLFFMIQTDLLPDIAKLSRAPEEAGMPPKDPFYQEVTHALGCLHPSASSTDPTAS